MFRNYLKIAFRNISRNKVFSFINIFGLAIGLTVSIIILVYVKHELSYDKFHDNYSNIYRLGISQAQGENIEFIAITSPAMGPDLSKELPEIKKFVRIFSSGGGIYTLNDENYESRNLVYADSTFFEVFSFDLLTGDPKSVLKSPNSIVLTESLANKIFKDVNPVGKQLIYNGDMNLMVTGVAKDPPGNSHFTFDALLSFNTFSEQEGFYGRWDGNFSYYTYLELQDGINMDELKLKMEDVFYENLNIHIESMGWKILPILEPIKDIYLKSELQYNIGKTGNIKMVYIFIAIAIFILLIAGINFMNLTTALSIKRIKEVAVRKVIGASRRRIIAQFLNESILISFIALIIALIFIETFMPGFNGMFNKELRLYTISNIDLLVSIPVIVILLGIISGSYPALIMSGFKPVSLMKGLIIHRKSKFSLQNILVVFQFVISIVLIISTTIIYFQINYMTNKDLGFNKENLLVVSLHSEKSVENSDVIRDRFIQNTNIINSTVASAFPANGLTQNGYRPEGSDLSMMFHALYVDFNYINTLGLEIVKGRSFNHDHPTDADKLLINETLANEMGWDDPIGKYIERNGKQEIIGVVKDFHFTTLNQVIAPLIITMKPQKSMIISKVKDNNLKETLEYMENEWVKLTGDNTFKYYFVSDIHDRLYKTDAKFGEIILAFSALAIFIACMGLFGLTAFITTQRTKEIGIRKSLGASAFSINKLILKQFINIVLVSMLFAWPIAYYAMNNWLQNYAYKINLHLGYFLIASVIALIIAIVTISYQSFKAARTNPVESLKYE
ncbi:MAG: ABC transporter permease [Bacteroidales bacterium]|nr:ABC transporter permease [Bacteroidales bacterium]